MKFSMTSLAMISTFTLASSAVFAFDPLAQDQKWILGDWNGKRAQLEQQGYQFTAAFQNESAVNLSGGYDDSSRLFNANQWTFGTRLDLEKNSRLERYSSPVEHNETRWTTAFY